MTDRRTEVNNLLVLSKPTPSAGMKIEKLLKDGYRSSLNFSWRGSVRPYLTGKRGTSASRCRTCTIDQGNCRACDRSRTSRNAP